MTDGGPTLLEPGGTNSVGRMLGLLGDEWSLLILGHSSRGLTRYGEFHRAMPISNSVLTHRLTQLSEHGLLERRIYRTNPLRAEYLPTARSRTLWPMMLAIWEWERRWTGPAGEALPRRRHDTCGAEFAPLLTCRACGDPVEARDIRAAWGPSGSWERSVPASATRRRPDSVQDSLQYPQTLELFGNRWSSALIGAAFRGMVRFSEFESALGAPPTLIAERLRAFVGLGVLESRQHARHPGRPEYHLTDKGRAFFPVTALSLHWAEKWFVSPEGPALVQTHTACGEDFVAHLACDQCRQPLVTGTITIVPVTEDRTAPEEGTA